VKLEAALGQCAQYETNPGLSGRGREKKEKKDSARSMCAGELTWMPFLGRKKNREEQDISNQEGPT